MKRIRMIVQYEGTNYVGWQTQANGPSIQQTIEKEIKKLSGESAALHGSGRTDSGVHALAQVAHFDTESRIPPDKWCYALNAGLPDDIRVLYSGEASLEFHARFGVQKKHYRYTLQLGPHAQVFCRKTALHLHHTPDFALMEQSAAQLLGTHDFAAFKSTGVDVKSTVRTIYRSEWTRSGDMAYYDVAGSGFMYNMVRILTGTMLEIGGGLLPENAVTHALESGNRSDAGATAPACGLMLQRVEYLDFDTADYVLTEAR